MHQRALRTVLLIQAIEETDRPGEVIPLADRADASRAALRDSPPPKQADSNASLSAGSEAFLVRRAERLLASLNTRSPVVMHVLALAGGLTWAGRFLIVGAFAAGASLAALDGSRRINILAFPLIGLLAWNLFVYLLLLLAWIRTRGRTSTGGPATFYNRWIAGRIEALLRHATRFNVPLTTGLRRFAMVWGTVSQPLLLLRAKRLLHLAAALMAIGLILGLYVRGIALRYEAGWESTFLGPASAQVLIATLYGAASTLSGIPVGSVENIAALRWTPTGGGGEAASWIHLIALTAVLYIVIPRLLAALAATVGLWRYSRKPPLPPSLLGYARALVMSVGTGSVREVASVIPYAYEPRPESVAGLESLLGATLGPNLTLELRKPVAYGEEENIGGLLAHWNVLLMTLSATPEGENHGALLAGLRDWLIRNASAAPLLVVLDEAQFGARMRGDAGFEKRLQERRTLWREFVAGYGLRACFVDLTRMRPGTAPEIEARDSARAALWTAGETA